MLATSGADSGIRITFFSALIITMTILAYLYTKTIIHKLRHLTPNELALKDWFGNLIPFRSIKVLINQVHPGERIIRKKLCYEFMIPRANITYNIFHLLYYFDIHIIGLLLNFPLPATMVETDQGYYIDRRLQKLINSGFYTIVLICLITTYINSDLIITYATFGVLFLFFFQIIPSLFWQIFFIEPIRGSWLEKKEVKGKILTLSGEVPANEPYIYLSSSKFLNIIGPKFKFKRLFVTL